MHLHSKRIPLLLAGLASLICAGTVSATPTFLSKENPMPLKVDEYWTPERMSRAKPFPMPTVDPSTIHQSIPQVQGDDQSGDGHPPTVVIRPDTHQIIDALVEKTATHLASTRATFNRGGTKDDFTSSRLVPLTADLSYPYTTVGKLFFTIPGRGDFVCSASVLRPRIILTAGHCVHSGSGGQSGFFTNWKFVPAFRDGAAPFRTWNWAYVTVTNTWSTGGGTVPNAADYGMLEAADNVINDVTRTIGSVTGWLGWQTLSLMPNHAHLLGYPCNLDSCQKMHQVTAQSARSISPNNVEYGSDMQGGSSGGPWVQNFGTLAVGQAGGTNTGLNRIVGITSWVYTNTSQMAEGSSIPDQRFIDLLNSICAHRAGNC